MVRPATYRFRPDLRLSLFVVVMLPVLLWLGTWQLERAAGKAEREAAIAAMAARPHRPLAATTPSQVADLQPVSVRGHFLAGQLILLDNRTHRGRVGYEIYAPLRLETPVPTGAGEPASVVLVNLGWIPAPADRRTLPTPSLPAGTVEITGRVARSREAGVVFGPATEQGWPLRVQRIEVDELARRLGTALYPHPIIADATAPGVQVPIWQPLRMAPARHRGYAVQWYGLALVLLVGWVAASLRRTDRPVDSFSSGPGEAP